MEKPRLVFGGAHLKSAPKAQRPIDTKSATHLTLKASKSVLRLPKTIKIVNSEVEKACAKHGFRLYKFSNNFNHLHILIRVTNRYRWRAFLRELTGRIAQRIRETLNFTGVFWLGRPFTRIIKGWGRNFKTVREYIELNILEACEGLSREQARLLRKLRLRYD